MAYLMRYDMTERIIDVLKEFSSFVKNNENHFSKYTVFEKKASESEAIIGNTMLMQEMLGKLNTDALVSMYKSCGALADKYDLRSKILTAGYEEADLIERTMIPPSLRTNGSMSTRIRTPLGYMSWNDLMDIGAQMRLQESIQRGKSNMPPSGSNVPPTWSDPGRIPGLSVVQMQLDSETNRDPALLPGTLDMEITLPYPVISEKVHDERNKYQHQCAPPNVYFMEAFCRIGLFTYYGTSITHNLPEVQQPLSSGGLNHDYRGAKETAFCGMQFIYNQSNIRRIKSMLDVELLDKCANNETEVGDIVISRINIGTV